MDLETVRKIETACQTLVEIASKDEEYHYAVAHAVNRLLKEVTEKATSGRPPYVGSSQVAIKGSKPRK